MVLWLGDKSLEAIIEEPLGVKALETAINYLSKRKKSIKTTKYYGIKHPTFRI